MLDITISQIVNEIDQSEYVLYMEWTNQSFKVILFKSSMEPLFGEMLDNDINFYSKEHSKSCDEYLKETRDALSGKDTEIQYFLQDNKFEWRRNKKWILGKIVVHPASDTLVISEALYNLVKWQQQLQEVLSKLRKENESLLERNKDLCLDIEKMIKMKTDMEKELYQKFILILNAKKDKIRKLENLLSNKKNKKETVFDASTDQSEDSDLEQKTVKAESNVNKEVPAISSKKRVQKLMSYESTDESENSDTEDKQSFHVSSKKSKFVISNDFENEIKGTAGTSEKIQKIIPKNAKLVSSISSNESECELDLKIPESCTINKSSIGHLEFEEESEEELFS